jgi:hypothetical protein
LSYHHTQLFNKRTTWAAQAIAATEVVALSFEAAFNATNSPLELPMQLAIILQLWRHTITLYFMVDRGLQWHLLQASCWS